MSAEQELLAHVQSRARRERRTTILLAVALVFVLGYTTWLRSQLTQVTPELLVTTASAKIQADAPGAISGVADSIAKQSPELVGAAFEQAKALPAMARAYLEPQLLEAINHGTDVLHQQMEESIARIYGQHRTALLEATKDLPADRRLEALADETMKGFAEELASSADALHGAYGDRLRKATAYLKRLRTASDLTPAERLHKDLVQTTLVLLKQKTGKAVTLLPEGMTMIDLDWKTIVSEALLEGDGTTGRQTKSAK